MRRITRIAILGDSLSDRGTLDRRKLLNVIPMGYVSGLWEKSSNGRFANGFLWGDYLCATTAQEFEINFQRRKLKLGRNPSANADISDEFLTNSALQRKSDAAFSLNDDMHVLFRGKRFTRVYCEGGLTAYDYASTFTFDPILGGSRLILATLEDKRKLLLADDKKYRISKQEKVETLVIEWSGANDLITVNSKPSHKAADDAVTARMNNIETLILKGYRNFVLFNIPNLSLTPRFQARSDEEKNNASECCEYFNARLAERCAALNKKYLNLHIPIHISVFDVDAQFKKIYKNPEQYSFDRDKLKTPFISSAEYQQAKQDPKNKEQNIIPSTGYMFWDDVHPTADTHSWLAQIFKEQCDTIFDFKPPRHRVRCRDDYEIGRHTHNFWKKNHPKPTPKLKMKEDIAKILDTLHTNARSMCNSWFAARRAKGELLKQLIFELKTQHCNLEEMHGVISAFAMNPDNKKVLQVHHYPVYDYFVGKKTTRSEDTISDLANALQSHIDKTSGAVSAPMNI